MDDAPRPSPVAQLFLLEFVTPDLPDLGPCPRPDRLTTQQVEDRLDRVMAELPLPARARSWLHAAALLWHDHLDASHSISQAIQTADGSFLHGIMHRREPDYGNARYWFNRVGNHPAGPPIGRAVNAALRDAGDCLLAERLAPGGKWDPFAFIDACEAAEDAGDAKSLRERLREVQAIEFQQLIRHVLA